MKNYALTIRVPFEAFDDVEARKFVIKKLEEISLDGAELKLQEVFENKAPRKVSTKQVR